MSQIGEPKRFIVVTPVYEPVPTEQPIAVPVREPEPEEVPADELA